MTDAAREPDFERRAVEERIVTRLTDPNDYEWGRQALADARYLLRALCTARAERDEERARADINFAAVYSLGEGGTMLPGGPHTALRESALLVDALRAQVGALREALAPFARQWDVLVPYHELPSDKIPLFSHSVLTYADLRRARSVLKEAP